MKETNYCSNQRLKIKSNLARVRLLLHFPWGWLVGLMSCLVHTLCSSHVLEMAAETRLGLCQMKQAKDQISSRTQKWDGLGKIWKMCLPRRRLSWKKSAWKVWCNGPSCSLPDTLTPGTQQPGKATPLTLSPEHWPAAPSPGAVPLHSLCFGCCENSLRCFR